MGTHVARQGSEETANGGQGEPDLPLGTVVGAATIAFSLLVTPLVLISDRVGGELTPAPPALVATAAEGYLEAWERGDLATMELLIADPGPEFETVQRQVSEQLRVEAVRFRAGRPEVAGDRASVPFAASVDLAGFDTWDYEGRLDLVLAVPAPRAVEAAPVVDPDGDTLDRPGPTAGAIPLPAVQDEQPRWMVMWSPATIHPRLLPGRTLVLERVAQERAPLTGVDGTPLTGEDAPDLPALDAQLLGAVGTLDETAAAARGADFVAGDEVGTSGLQAAFESQLGGRPSGSVNLVEVDDGDLVEVLHVFAGEAPSPVQTTLDPAVQAAAESALARLSRPAALVAIDGPTGQVRAVASRPINGFNRALVGQYPPGSTFKVVTTTALLAAGTAPETPVSCPATTSVGGFRFSNAGGEVLGDIPFATAFYRSCNTAFVQLANELEAGELVTAAETYGFNQTFDELGVAAEAGRFPDLSGPVDQAAAAIGQGRVTATPLQMATVAAAAATGVWHEPRLTVSEAPAAVHPLEPATAATLRELMLLVVEQGTATAAALPGEPVGGKTGTAEFGTARPPRTHAWFIGFRGDLAVAVLVEDAGFGGSVAAPVARDFFAEVG